MWIYLPASTSSRSAQELAASTLGLDSLSQRLEQSATWKGKSLPRKSWLRALKTAPSTKLLFGRTFERLTASRGVERWIASLLDTPANRFPPRAGSKAAKIRATSGRTSRASSAKSSRSGSSSKTSPTTCGLDFARSPKSYDAWITGLRRDSLARRKFAHLTEGSDSSSWLTPHGMSSQDHSGKNGAGGEFAKQAFGWQTPATDSFRSRGGDRVDEQGLDQQARNWGTPTIGTAGGLGQEDPKGSRLQDQARTWPTPNSSESNRGSNRRYIYGDNRTGRMLRAEAESWPTPNAHDATGARGKGFELTDHHYKPHDLVAVACQSSLQARTNSKPGKNSSASMPRLNPRFVEMLQGFPPGWTALGHLATPSFLSWRQRHIELFAPAMTKRARA